MFNSSNISDASRGKNLNKIIKITFIFALLIVVLYFFCSLVIFPRQNQRNLGVCVFEAKKNYDEQWTTTRLSLFSPELIKEYGKDRLCATMTAEDADPIEQNYQKQIDDCLNRYHDNAGK